MRTRELAQGGPKVTAVGVGTSPLGSMPDAYGYEVDRDRAIATVDQVLASPIRFLDTSNEYSKGEAERRIGAALQGQGGKPEGFAIATKADPAHGATDFPGVRVRESFRESAERLGVDHFDVFYLHDPERFPFETMTAAGGALDALVELRDEGLVDVIGVAGGDIVEMHRYTDTGVLDVVLNHSQYVLLDRSADSLIDHVVASGAAFVNAAPYASGMLAKPASAHPNYHYGAPSEAIIAQTGRLRALCERFDVPLAAAALQFSTRDERISSTIVGVSTPQRVDELVSNEELDIPEDLWSELWELLDFQPRRFNSVMKGT